MRVHPTKTDNPRPARGPAYYRLKLGRGAASPRYWPSWLLVLGLRLIALLPLPVSRVLGAGVGLLMFALNAKRRHIARVNLRLCFPEKSERERRRLLRRHFRVKGQSYVDLGFLAWASEARIRHKTRFHGLEHLRAAGARGRNVILLAPHCLGMNFAASALARQHAEFSMMKVQRNPVVNWLLNKSRMRFGLKLVARTQGLRPVVRALKHGHAFYYLPDEDFGPRHSVFAPFFGVPTATLATLGRLADLTDAVVIPLLRAPAGARPRVRGDAQAGTGRFSQARNAGGRGAHEPCARGWHPRQPGAVHVDLQALQDETPWHGRALLIPRWRHSCTRATG